MDPLGRLTPDLLRGYQWLQMNPLLVEFRRFFRDSSLTVRWPHRANWSNSEQAYWEWRPGIELCDATWKSAIKLRFFVDHILREKISKKNCGLKCLGRILQHSDSPARWASCRAAWTDGVEATGRRRPGAPGACGASNHSNQDSHGYAMDKPWKLDEINKCLQGSTRLQGLGFCNGKLPHFVNVRKHWQC